MGQGPLGDARPNSLRAACAACAAGPGEPCRNPDGSTRWSTHRERVEALMRFERTDELRAMAYPDYLATPEWGRLVAMKLIEADHRCQVCNCLASLGNPLDVHHRTYERRGCERLADLTVLCRVHHRLVHGRWACARCHSEDHYPIPEKQDDQRATAGRP